MNIAPTIVGSPLRNAKTAIGDFGRLCLISCPQPAVVDAGRHNLLYAADVPARNPLAADA
jgi:hypothetical protein